MVTKAQLAAPFVNFGRQFIAFGRIRAIRSFRVRSRHTLPAIRQPEWQLILCLTLTLVILGFLFIDEAAGHWKSTISRDTYAIFRQLTRLGKSEFLLIPAAIAVLSFGFFSWAHIAKSAKAVLANYQLLGLYIFGAVAGSGLSNNLLKILFGRARPRHFDDLGPFHFDPPGLSSGFQSFPSGHSTTAGAMAIIFMLLFPRYKWIWLTFSAWVAGSRVIVGAHYPSDSVAGFFYGAAFAWLLALWFANRRLLFRAQDGAIRLPSSRPLSPAKLASALAMLIRREKTG